MCTEAGEGISVAGRWHPRAADEAAWDPVRDARRWTFEAGGRVARPGGEAVEAVDKVRKGRWRDFSARPVI